MIEALENLFANWWRWDCAQFCQALGISGDKGRRLWASFCKVCDSLGDFDKRQLGILFAKDGKPVEVRQGADQGFVGDVATPGDGLETKPVQPPFDAAAGGSSGGPSTWAPARTTEPPPKR